MKNKIAVTVLLLLICCLVTGLAACNESYKPTGLEMSGSYLTWQEIDGAEGYEVDIENVGTFETEKPNFTVEVPSAGIYKIRVRAKVNGEYGEYSDVFEYVVSEMLDKPVIEYNELTKEVSWNAVENASGYVVRVKDSTDKAIETSEVSGTAYTLEKEEYSKPGIFSIQVKAVAPANSGKSDSPYSDEKTFTNTATLSTPTLSSITGTRVYWNSVANAASYYLEARNKENAEEIYSTSVKASTSTSVSVLFTSFVDSQGKSISQATPGEYTIHIKTVGDGEVYFDSAMSDVDSEGTFVIYKLPQLGEDSLYLVDNGDGTTTASWRVSSSQEGIDLITSFTLVLTPYNSEGETVLSAQRITFNLASESDMEKLTTTTDGDYTVYSYVIDTKFLPEEGNSEYPLNDAYYGKRFTVALTATKSGNGVISGEDIVADEKYLSFKTPAIDESTGAYKIGSAAELAYIVKNPDADFVQTADIDFENYEWLSLDSFGGTYNGSNFVIFNIAVIGEGENVGFFGEVAQGAEVRGLKLVNASLENEKAAYAGLICGVNNGTIADCIVTGSVTAKVAVAGGIAGLNNGNVSSSQSVAEVTAAVAGGFAGKNAQNATLSYSVSKGNVTAKAEKAEEDQTAVSESFAGGFVAVNDGSVIGCNAVGNVVSGSDIKLQTPNYAGGFVALNNGSITLSYAGANYSNTVSRRNTVISTDNENIAVGGFVGYNNGSISNCYSTVKATSPRYVGGFVGYNAGSIENAYSVGGITTGNSNYGDGGFVGFNADGATVSNVYYYDEDLKDSPDRTDSALSEFVALDQIGSDLAGKLGDAFGYISGDHEVKNAVLRNIIYNVSVVPPISPGVEVNTSVQFVKSDGTVGVIEASSSGEATSGYYICGNLNQKGTALIVFSNGSYRGLVIVTID